MAKDKFIEAKQKKFEYVNRLSFNYYKDNIEKEIKKFEPSMVSNNIKNISKEDFEYIKECSEVTYNQVYTYNLNYSKDRIVPLFSLYTATIRMIYSRKNAEHLKKSYDIKDEALWQLLIVLSSDPDLKYYKLYIRKKEEGLNNQEITEYFNKYYNFYSYKLLYMEMQTYSLINKLRENENNIKSNQRR